MLVTDLFASQEIQDVLNSDIAINALLTKLKKSILVCEEFTKFIRKKYIVEESYLDELSKQYRNFFNSDNTIVTSSSSVMHRNIVKVCSFDGSMAQVRQNYIQSLMKMYDELSSLLLTMTKLRKSVKDISRHLEKNVADAIHLAEKAQNRYISLCQDWERLRLADPTKTKLTLRGSKNYREQEEELTRKIDSADLDYSQKVDIATSLRDKFITIERPRIVTELKDLILELDIAITIQLQKYSILYESMIVNSGTVVSPISTSNKVSMKSISSTINNEHDLYDYLKRFTGNRENFVNKNLIPVSYSEHPSMKKGRSRSLSSSSANKVPLTFAVDPSRNSIPKRLISTHNETPFTKSNIPLSITSPSLSVGRLSVVTSPPLPGTPILPKSTTLPQLPNSGNTIGTGSSLINVKSMVDAVKNPTVTDNGIEPKVIDQNTSNEKPGKSFKTLDPSLSKANTENISAAINLASLEANRPVSRFQPLVLSPPITPIDFKVFGKPLEKLFEYEQDMVPSIVRQCIHVIDKYGLELEGIYRVSPVVTELTKLKEEVDNNPSSITTLIPPPNHTEGDIHLVASLLKAFFAALPDTLFPDSFSTDLMTCLFIDDVKTRRNYMHGLIYQFPDAQYWTLRSLVFHLKRIIAHEDKNRMNMKAISIIWGPALIPPNKSDVNDVDFHIQLFETLFSVADQAFEPE